MGGRCKYFPLGKVQDKGVPKRPHTSREPNKSVAGTSTEQWNPTAARNGENIDTAGWHTTLPEQNYKSIPRTVNGPPSMPHRAACFTHRGKRDKHNHHSVYTSEKTLGKLNARNCGGIIFQNLAFASTTSYGGGSFKNLSSHYPNNCFGGRRVYAAPFAKT